MKTKFSILLFVPLFFTIHVNGQNFEGEVTYMNKFKSQIKNLSDEQLEKMIGSKENYFIKGGNYKSILNGQTLVMQLYDVKSNRLYNQKFNSDTLYWFDFFSHFFYSR
jgi:hypothetical protein